MMWKVRGLNYFLFVVRCEGFQSVTVGNINRLGVRDGGMTLCILVTRERMAYCGRPCGKTL